MLNKKEVTPEEVNLLKAPWLQKFLKLKLAEAEEKTQGFAAQVLVCDEKSLDRMRLIAAGCAGMCTAFEELMNIEYSDVVDLSEGANDDA